MMTQIMLAPSHHFLRMFQPHRYFCDVIQQSALDHITLPWILEIGSGKGHFACQLAQSIQDAHIIAIERTYNKAISLKNKVQNLPCTNITALHTDAIAFTACFVKPKQLKAVYIMYPNPEPHNKNQRFVNMPFFEFLLSRLSDDGIIYLATNISEYAQESIEMLKNVWRVDATMEQIPSHSARTMFEQKYLQRGEACWEIRIQKPVGYRTRFCDAE